TEIKGGSGPACARRRAERLRDLLARATPAERDLLVRLVLGDLRQGALEGIVTEAVARAFEVPLPRVRRALMLSGSLPPVAAALAEAGAAGLDRFDLRLFRPVQ